MSSSKMTEPHYEIDEYKCGDRRYSPLRWKRGQSDLSSRLDENYQKEMMKHRGS